MANHKSAKKRILVNEKARLRNRSRMSVIRKAVKTVRVAVEKGEGDLVKLFQSAQSIIATSARKGILNKKTADRKISRLSKLIKTKS